MMNINRCTPTRQKGRLYGGRWKP